MWRWLFVSLLCTWLGGCTERSTPKPEPKSFGFPKSFSSSKAGLELAPAFPGIEVEDPTAMVEAGGRYFVAQQDGRIYGFERGDDTRTLVLDLSARTQSGIDAGLLAIALHPEFGVDGSDKRGFLYAYYLFSDDPIPADEVKPKTATRARLSRFTIPDGEWAADQDSELVLIDLLDQHIWHQGGGMFFHPDDGFLYLAIGDEGSTRCTFRNCQHLDKSFYGGVLRIDVDQRSGEVSHPIRREPEEGYTEHYYVPNDNPFVDEDGVLEELYAIGLRNPHRMTHDPVSGQVFIGDVGHLTEEEVDVLAPGANYQWDLFEGMAASKSPSDPTIARPGTWTDPALAFPHEELGVLIGGYVYRGDALPSLYGKYLYADFLYGNVWASSFDVEDGRVRFHESEIVLETRYAERSDGFTSFARDSDGRLYLLVLGKGRRILELQAAKPLEQRVPERLSDTGLFQDMESLRPSPALIEYEVNAPLWSDGAHKRRFIALPEGEQVGFARKGAFRFPPGTLFVKHFERALDARKPGRRRRLETRVLIVSEGGVYGLTYKWNAEQTDAELLQEHVEDTLELVDADGEAQRAVHVYPSPGECLRCHDPEGARVLGFKTSQLNLEHDGHEQLAALSELGVFEEPPAEDELDELPRLVALDDESAPVETRVRSYLDANCSHCHGERSPGETRWDARFETPLAEQGIVDAPLFGRNAEEDGRVVAPGDLARSELYQRVSSTDPALRMPPLASLEPDAQFIELLEQWIGEL